MHYIYKEKRWKGVSYSCNCKYKVSVLAVFTFFLLLLDLFTFITDCTEASYPCLFQTASRNVKSYSLTPLKQGFSSIVVCYNLP